MKTLSWKHVIAVALCLCLAVTLFTAFSLTRNAHAASTCQGRRYAPGTFLLQAGQRVQWTTCKGNTMDLNYQLDDNFVLYLNGHPIWASNTAVMIFDSGDHVQFQKDGNLVVYEHNTFYNVADPIWSSHTYGKHATVFALQSDGNMVIYNASGPIWASHTQGH